jgi:hypothetical protein
MLSHKYRLNTQSTSYGRAKRIIGVRRLSFLYIRLHFQLQFSAGAKYANVKKKRMKKVMSFAEVLEAADKLSVDEQETIVDILHRRVIENRRRDLVKEVHEAQIEFNDGGCQPGTPEDITGELLS